MKRNVIRKNTGLNGISIERQIEIPDYDMTLQKLSTMTPYLEGRRVHKTLDHNKKKDEDPYNGHQYVDLGLPSGTLWATMNVGANSETDKGLYFGWGETEGYETIPNVFNGEYKNKWYDGYNSYTKYNETDNKTNLDLEDDAAHVNWGGNWHIPTREQLQELLDNTTVEVHSNDSPAYILLKSNINNNTLYFVSTGNGSNSDGVDIWSNQVTQDYKSATYCFGALPSFMGMHISEIVRKHECLSVRGVIDSK